MIIVDTTVWIDYLRGTRNPETEWLEVEADRKRLGLTDLNLCEILQGVRTDEEFGLVHTELRRFELFQVGGEQLAISAAKNYRRIREEGITVRKTIDCLIATFCLMNDFALLHRDRDFDAFERFLGLAVVHP